MLSLTYTLLLLQLIPKSAPQTKLLDIESYWKTTYVTDDVPDYWDHGPIYLPRLPFVKTPDIFPAWLPKKETITTETKPMEDDTETQVAETTSPETDITIITTPPTQEEYTTIPEETAIDITTAPGKELDSTRIETTTAQSTVALETTFYDENKKIEQTTESTPTTTNSSSERAYLKEIEPVIRALDRESTTDPFSVFLRQFLTILTTKRNEDLPLLINHFREYVSMLLTGGQLEPLGAETNTYIATRLLILEKYPMQALHDFFDVLQKKLAQRTMKLSKEVNDILDYMDDTYNEAEEEAMQAVLRETYSYPNTKNYNKIAQGFVDYVFLKPLIRVAGTSRGNVLFKMINDAIIKFAKPGDIRLSPAFHKNLRKSFKKRQKVRHESSSTDTEENISSKGSKESIDLSDISESLSESSNTITSSDEENESSNEETRKNYQFKNNKFVKTENFKKQNIFRNRIKSRKIKSYEVLSKLRPIQRKHYGDFDNNEEIHRNSYQHFLSSSSTTNNANVIKDTEYSDIEKVLKSKIYDSFRRMDNINYNTYTTLKQKLTSQVNEHEKSSETDYERELKRNIYKAVIKLLNK
ncbi:uncharacterized protein LOC134802246 [Cydia splendana]|uniref:uncharacterized protein LOC134802246 n=1 Tax=Cydia splendana TaxID=1100963 RepID=UPI0028F4C065